jgi:predicted transcriptional regulator
MKALTNDSYPSEEKIEIIYSANLTPKDIEKKMIELMEDESVKRVDKGNSRLSVTLNLNSDILDKLSKDKDVTFIE